jgi:hypothetical protein
LPRALALHLNGGVTGGVARMDNGKCQHRFGAQGRDFRGGRGTVSNWPSGQRRVAVWAPPAARRLP